MIPNVLQAGKYTVSVAVSYDGGHKFHDSQEKTVSFDVTRMHATAGMLVLDDDITLEKNY